MSKSLFDAQKRTCLSSVDLSRKGSIDAPILDLVAFINDQSNYFTTSSCSGRIIVVDNDVDGSIKKQGCKWILTSHYVVTLQELHDKLQTVEGNAVFKFEPFVMHVQCRTLEDAQLMLSTAVASGYRNSGISIGNKKKFITGIRSTHSIEVPLSSTGKLLVSDQYLEFIVGIANGKMKENFERIERFFKALKCSMDKSEPENQKLKSKEKLDHDRKFSQTLNVDNGKTVSTSKQELVLERKDSLEDLSQCALFLCDLDS